MKKFAHLLISLFVGLSLVLLTSEDIFSAQTKVYVRMSGKLSTSSSVSASGGDISGSRGFSRVGGLYFRYLTSGKTYTITASSGGKTVTKKVSIPYTFAIVVTIYI